MTHLPYQTVRRTEPDERLYVVCEAEKDGGKNVLRHLTRSGARFEWSKFGTKVTVFGFGKGRSSELRRRVRDGFAHNPLVRFPPLAPCSEDSPMIPFDIPRDSRNLGSSGSVSWLADMPTYYLPPVAHYLFRLGFSPGFDGRFNSVGLFDDTALAKRERRALRARFGKRRWLRLTDHLRPMFP